MDVRLMCISTILRLYCPIHPAPQARPHDVNDFQNFTQERQGGDEGGGEPLDHETSMRNIACSASDATDEVEHDAKWIAKMIWWRLALPNFHFGSWDKLIDVLAEVEDDLIEADMPELLFKPDGKKKAPKVSEQDRAFEEQSQETADVILNHLESLGKWSFLFEDKFKEDEIPACLQLGGEFKGKNDAMISRDASFEDTTVLVIEVKQGQTFEGSFKQVLAQAATALKTREEKNRGVDQKVGPVYFVLPNGWNWTFGRLVSGGGEQEQDYELIVEEGPTLILSKTKKRIEGQRRELFIRETVGKVFSWLCFVIEQSRDASPCTSLSALDM
ncbi:hypothetical protein HK102_004675 [Quaeritorhiza haematococci]|nr:hypothetical protein HK102_004675 [Quaeritorhiza haematococci]